jgi:hypothetical protein
MRQGCQHVHSLQISCSLAQPLAVLIAVIFESGGGALHRQWQQTGRRPARRDDARSNCSASARAGKRERHKAHLYPQCFGIEKHHGAGGRASCARRVVCADEQHSGKRRRLFVCTVSNFKRLSALPLYTRILRSQVSLQLEWFGLCRVCLHCVALFFAFH